MFRLRGWLRDGSKEPSSEAGNDLDTTTMLSDASEASQPTQFVLPLDPSTGYTYTGFNMLQIALSNPPGNSCKDSTFQRRVYVDSLGYLLRGLPKDLSQAELDTIRGALPLDVTTNLEVDKPPHYSARSSEPSLLHRSLASMVILSCLAVRLLVPYIKYYLAAAWRYERSHHVSEKLLASGISTADILGKKTIELATITLGHQTVTNGLEYCVDGVRGGLTEGFGEGMKFIEAPANQ